MCATVRKAIVIIAFVMILTACGSGDGDAVRLHEYDEAEEIYRKAITRARSEHPSYFSTARDVGVEGDIKGVRILGRENECVYFVNTSDIIIEESLPVYCFRNGTLEFSHNL